MAAIAGAGVVHADVGGRPGSGTLPIQPQSPGLAERIWWGSGRARPRSGSANRA